ncbi:restriction endonuclease subunit S [Sandaracinomonas limnophila]|uniref:Restriction endonuclease subunit S n=1 Tax=Sandaracinomonas limnophila TaxID=1862386 RepID=A0A437PXL4_9BACT|nr:restriction endonuclease subunit S [Sandaracinomonas limnophila]RVU26980.1 restriction endonuclease subunit S [Sandaracinomonas limnophila]
MSNTTTYKQTAIGLIPIDWEIKKLGKIAKTTAGGTPSTQKKEYWGGNIKWMSSGDLNLKKIFDVEGRITESGLKNSSTKLIPAKCVLIGLAGQGKTRGTVAMNLIELCTNQSVAAILPSNEFNEEYLYYNLDFRYNELRQLSTGDGGRGGLNLNIINSILIPIPPIQEQQKIAEILGSLDEAINISKQIVDSLKNRNIGIVQQLLSGKTRLNGYEKSQWHLKSLEEVAIFKNGKAHENSIDVEGDYIVVNSKFISTDAKISKASSENLCPLYKNEIVMVMSDIPNGKALAKCFYIDANYKYTLNQRICALTAKKGTESKFLFHLLNRNSYYLAFNNGVSQTNLKKDEVLECPLLMPDIEEQKQIVKVIDTAIKELNQYQQKLETLQLQKKGLMQQLLTGKTRVRI